MVTVEQLQTDVHASLGNWLVESQIAHGELTIEIAPQHLREACFMLRDAPTFEFKLLIDLCGVDYQDYGMSEWETTTTTATGFERGVQVQPPVAEKKRWGKHRFASVYHLLSLTHNQRLRIRVLLDEAGLTVPSVTDIWPAADWYERESFDLFGIMYSGHPDLRRLLTDYGFIGHPFRKDFPLIGEVEARYDASVARVVYEPVSIQPRVLEPKVIRDDNRYSTEKS